MTLISQLATLESSGLIHLARAQPELEYLFRHALVHDAAYASLVKADRLRLHHVVGEALERGYRDGPASRDLAPRLARHFHEAGDYARGLPYSIQAGDQAAAQYANAEAITHYTRALDAASQSASASTDQLRHIYTRRGLVLELNAQDAEALANYEEMETVARARGNRKLELAGMAARATVYCKPTSVSDLARGRALSERALDLARELGDREIEAKALWNLLMYYKSVGSLPDALQHGEKALALARELNLREQVAYVLNDIHAVYISAGHTQHARETLAEAQRLWRELGVLNMLADSLASSAAMHVFAGEFEPAFTAAEEALRISQAIGNLWNQSYSLFMLNLAYWERGEIGRAIEVSDECIRLAEQAGFVPALIQARSVLALIYGDMGAIARGLEIAQTAQALADERFPTYRPMPLAVIAHLHMLAGNRAEAEIAFEAAHIALQGNAADIDAAFFEHVFIAESLLARNDYTGVVALVDEGVPLVRQRGMRAFLPDALGFKGKALLALGRVDEARAVLDEARAEAEAIGSRRALWPILTALSRIETQQGRVGEAESLRDQARQHVDFIAEQAGSPELRASFLNLPRVREALRADEM